MKTLRLCLLTGVVLGIGCGDDGGVVTTQKAEVDEAALTDGILVNIQGDLGEVIVPFLEPVPDVPDDDFEDEMVDSVALVVTSPRSLASADLMAGTVVEDAPTGPGQFTWTLNGDRDAAQLIFFNETPGGLTLEPGLDYVVQLQVSTNDYVEKLPAITFDANVQ